MKHTWEMDIQKYIGLRHYLKHRENVVAELIYDEGIYYMDICSPK